MAISQQRVRPRSLRDREVREVLDDHFYLRERGELEEDLRRNHAEDVVLLNPVRCFRGHDGVRDSAEFLYKAVGGEGSDGYQYHSIVTDDRVGLLEWSARNDEMRIADGVDSYLIEDGLILVQTIRYTVTFADLSQAKSIK